MKHERTVMGNVRRIGVRVALEVLQGVGARNPTNPSAKDEVPPNVEESLNFPYINRAGVPLAMDIFKPVGSEYDGKELPVIVSIHGGGLVTGDRKISLKLGREMASRGYLVFAIEYRLAPRATICEQLDDVCAGMDYVGKKIVEYDVDPTRIFLTADSGGAFLAIYTAAMKRSKKLQDAIGYKPSRMTFKALGLSGGMFYTNGDDLLGMLLAEQFYGDKFDDKKFLQYMNPEHPEIINNLPPTFLVTARGDFLNNYTLMFHKALKNAGKTTKLLYYGESDLFHTFNFSRPYLPQSKDANDKMVKFFEEQAALAKARQKTSSGEKKRAKEIEQEIAEGAFARQRLWEAISGMNSESKDKLDAVAVVDDSRKYTYRQMLRQWKKYAEVFSALGMSEKGSARVGILGAMTAEAASSFYALDMTGAFISMLPYPLAQKTGQLIELIKKEKLTDLILTDYEITPALLRRLTEEREEIGLKSIIVLHTEAAGPCASESEKRAARDNELQLKKVEGALFMPELLAKYEATPISYAAKSCASTSMALHTQKDDTGEYSAVSFSDEQINAIALEGYGKHKHRRFIGLTLDLYNTHSLAKQLHQALLLNDSVLMTYKAGYSGTYSRAVEAYHVDTLLVYASLVRQWRGEEKPVNFASIDQICIEDKTVTKEELAQIRQFLEERGAKAEVKAEKSHAGDYAADVAYGDGATAGSVAPAFVPFPLPPLMPQLPYAPGSGLALGETDEARKKRLEKTEDWNRHIQRVSKALALLSMTKDSIKEQKEKKAEVSGTGASAKGAEDKGPSRLLMDVLGVLFDASTVDYYVEK